MEMMDEYRKAQQKLQKGVDYNIKTVKAFATSLKRYFNFSLSNNRSSPNFKGNSGVELNSFKFRDCLQISVQILSKFK